MKKNYDVCSFFLLPALTLALAAGFSLTETNLSAIANREGRRVLFLIWGVLAGNYAYFYIQDLMEFARCEDKAAGLLALVSYLSFLSGVGLPYLPGRAPLLSELHIWASFGGPVLLCAALWRFAKALEKESGTSLRGERMALGILILPAGGLYLFAGMISSLLEIYVICAVCVYLAVFQWKLEKIRLSNH